MTNNTQKHTSVNDGGDIQVVKHFGAVLPGVGVSVLALALLIKSIHLNTQARTQIHKHTRTRKLLTLALCIKSIHLSTHTHSHTNLHTRMLLALAIIKKL